MESLFINWMREVSQRHLKCVNEGKWGWQPSIFLFFRTRDDINQSLNTDLVLDTGTTDLMKGARFLSKSAHF